MSHAGPVPEELGLSREGRPILGLRFGSGGTRISLIAGCHADEPAGPRLLRRLAAHLDGEPDPIFPDASSLLRDREWWLVPHSNPDGEARNRPWQAREPDVYDLADYLAHAVRELPGDDMEFGFPWEGEKDAEGAGPPLRPENRAIHAWWRSAPGPFHLHVSLHGMGFAGGPWLLIEPTWAERARPLREAFEARARDLGYVLHDVERLGEKGFFRLGRGFATRPDSRHMRDHFLARGDPGTAARFRPSSMETHRALARGVPGADPLTLVTEMPLFITPGAGERIGPPDPAAEEWRERISGWRAALRQGREGREEGPEPALQDRIRAEARAAGLHPVPAQDQMALQWEVIRAGIDLVEVEAR